MSELRSTVRELCLYFVGIEATRPGLSGLELTRPQTAMGRLSLCPPTWGPARHSSSAARARSSSEKTSKELVVSQEMRGGGSPFDLLSAAQACIPN